MRRSIRVTTRAALLALSAFCAASVMAQDPAKVAPDVYKVRLDNAKVRVLEVTGKAGQKAPMHRHLDYLVYSLADGSVKHSDAKGAVSDSALKAGQAVWRGAESHASEVVSDRYHPAICAAALGRPSTVIENREPHKMRGLQRLLADRPLGDLQDLARNGLRVMVEGLRRRA